MATYEQEFNETDLAGLISHEIRQSLDYDQSEISEKRSRALEYLRGEMNDTEPRTNGSKVTSRDLADTMSWMLPGIMRVFMSSDRMAEYEPVLEGDTRDAVAVKQAEDSAEQASDYIAHAFFKDNDGYRIVYNGTHDALSMGDGVVKTWWDDKPETETSVHSRLTIEQVAQLTEGDDVEILTQEANKEPDIMLDPETGEPVPVETYNIKIERTTSRGRLSFDSIEPENFLIDDAATTIEEARFTAHRDPYVTRSDLIEKGFDREKVEALSADNNMLDTEESYSRQSSGSLIDNSMMRSTQRVDLYECFLRVDVDGDGVAETIRVYYAGDAGAGSILDWEVWDDETPFDTIPCYPQPHRFESESVADRTMDIQKIKTILQRQALDNLYASNLPMQEVDQGSVINTDILVSPKFGGIIWKKPGSGDVRPHVIPFVADKVFAATEYFDSVIEKRTGVSRTMMALDPEALQNQSATANQNAKDASFSQVELVARHQAELGWRKVFRKALRLVVKHQDRPRTIRLRDSFVEMDPKHWNASMDVTVNVGLGTGSRDRDMAMLQNVLQSQLMILDRLTAVGFDREALEMLARIRRTLIKMAEAAGLRNPDQFYPEIDEEQIERMAQQAQEQKGQPSEDMQIEQMRIQAQQQAEGNKVQAAAQAEQLKAQATAQSEQLKAEGNQVKEQAQLEADLQVKETERQNAMIIEGEKNQLVREKMATDAALQEQELAVKYDIEMKKLAQSAATTRSEKGKKPVPAAVADKGVASAMNGVAGAMERFATVQAMPRRVVRDEGGRILGVETDPTGKPN